MITDFSRSIFQENMVRNRKHQKRPFEQKVVSFLQKKGYEAGVLEQGTLFRHRNIVAGNPKTANVIFTAHYDTPPVLPFPNFITPKNFLFFLLYQFAILFCFLIPVALIFCISVWLTASLELSPVWPVLLMNLAWIGMVILLFAFPNRNNANDNTSGVVTLLEIAQMLPPELRDRVAFVFFDHEEWGMLGSSAFASVNRAWVHDKLVINFDCVSDGDYILFSAKKRVRRDAKTMAALKEVLVSEERKEMRLERLFYPSDQMMFKRSVAVAGMRRNRVWGYYLGRIHTSRDTIFEEENIDLLSRRMVRLTEII